MVNNRLLGFFVRRAVTCMVMSPGERAFPLRLSRRRPLGRAVCFWQGPALTDVLLWPQLDPEREIFWVAKAVTSTPSFYAQLTGSVSCSDSVRPSSPMESGPCELVHLARGPVWLLVNVSIG